MLTDNDAAVWRISWRGAGVGRSRFRGCDRGGLVRDRSRCGGNCPLGIGAQLAIWHGWQRTHFRAFGERFPCPHRLDHFTQQRGILLDNAVGCVGPAGIFHLGVFSLQTKNEGKVFLHPGRRVRLSVGKAQLLFSAGQIAGQGERQPVIGQRGGAVRFDGERALIGLLRVGVLVELVECRAECRPGFCAFGFNHAGLIEGARRGAIILLGRQGAAKDHQKIGAVGVNDENAGQHVDGAIVAANVAQGVAECDGGCQVFRILGVLLRPEIGLGQRV